MVKPLRLRPSFFKIMLADFKSQLRIPPGFMKHVRGRLGTQAELRIVNGKKWPVQVETKPPPHGHTYFSRGWRAFASGNSIRHGDFLTFHYDGASGFSIRPYGPDCSEKKQFPAAGFLKTNERKVMEKKMKMKMSPVPKKRERMQSPLIHNGRILANGGCCSFTPANPYYAFIFCQKYLNRLRIPRWLVSEYGLRNKKYINFEGPTGITWAVKLYHGRDGRVEFSNGWTDFHKGNHLRHGDVCILEIFEGGQILKVNIISANKEIAEQDKKPEITFSEDGEGSFPDIKLIEGNLLMNGDAQMNELIAFDGEGHLGKGSSADVKYNVETLLMDGVVSIEKTIPITAGGQDHLEGEDGFSIVQEKESSMIECDVQMDEKISIFNDEQIHGDKENIPDVQQDENAPLTYLAISLKEDNLIADGEVNDGGRENFPNLEPQEENFLTANTSIINGKEVEKDGEGSSHCAQKEENALRSDFVQMKEKTPTSDGGEGLEDDKGSLLDLQLQMGKPSGDGDVQLKEETPVANCGEHLEAVTTDETLHPHFSRTFGSTYYNVNIPRSIVKKLGLKHRQNMSLYDPSGELYRAKLAKRPNGTIGLVDGWYAWAKKNGIGSGDTCNFEFVASGELRLHIVRAGETGNTAL